MLNSCSTNHADIKDSNGRTAADVAREHGYHALARDVEAFQPGPRGELAINCWMYQNNYCSLSTFQTHFQRKCV